MEPDPLAPQLREAESLMDQALAEACDADPAAEADTGELIRVEEMLDIAADAAKQAIALRRRRREERKQSTARAAEVGAAEAAASATTAHREFTDAGGVTWDVYAVYPEARLSPKLRGPFQHGWLCFDSQTGKRRLSPIPANWQELTDEELGRLSDRAERARSRGSPRTSDDEPGAAEDRPPGE